MKAKPNKWDFPVAKHTNTYRQIMHKGHDIGGLALLEGEWVLYNLYVVLTSKAMRVIANKLDKLNKEYAQCIGAYMLETVKETEDE